MSKISSQRLDALLLQLSDSNLKIREEANAELLSLEEREMFDSVLLIDLLFQSSLSGQIFIIGALVRRQDEKTYPFIARFFSECRNSMLLQELIAAFTALETDYFLEPVLKKLNPEPKKKSLWKKKEEEPKGDSDAMISFQCLVPALKYFQEQADESVAGFLEKCLDHINDTVRFNALLAIHRRKLPLSDSKLIEISGQDSSVNVRRLADLILNPLEDPNNPDGI